MAKAKSTELPARQRPADGGSYIRNKETGELRPNIPAEPAEPSEVNNHG
jgi:hypothetical protein